jgi:hypothetical protein
VANCATRIGSTVGVTAAVTAALLLAGAARAEPPPDGIVGTWHVLIHYHALDGHHPDRWLWDERVWVIEPSGDGLEWAEHAIVSFVDTTDRFENLRTNMARRLTGAWAPNPAQRLELATGVTVGSRGMRRKFLARTSPGHWSSDPTASRVGHGAAGVGYHEVWSIDLENGAPRFAIENRFEVGAGRETSGETVYRIRKARSGAWPGRYSRGDDRKGRFRLTPTRILVDTSDDAMDPSKRPTPGSAARIELVPDQRVHSDVPLLVTVLRPFHYYGERRITINSSPPGAEVDLAYLRRGGQLMYRRGLAPLEVLLPTRLQADSADRLLVRGFLPGHERTRQSFAVDGGFEHVQIDLPPLENHVRSFAHGHLAGRSVLELRSSEPPTLRVARDEAGFSVVLVRTGLTDELGEQLSSLDDPRLEIQGRQLGDDTVLRLSAERAGELELRHRNVADPGMAVFRTRLEVAPIQDDGRVTRLAAAVAAMTASDLRPCRSAFETVLLEEISERALARTLGRDDHPEAPTLRGALRRLAAVSADGTVRTRSGTVLSVADPLEFELAWSLSADIEGYLAWLDVLALRVDPEDRGRRALRSLIAPDQAPGQFAEVMAAAESAADACRVSASATAGGQSGSGPPTDATAGIASSPL